MKAQHEPRTRQSVTQYAYRMFVFKIYPIYSIFGRGSSGQYKARMF